MTVVKVAPRKSRCRSSEHPRQSSTQWPSRSGRRGCHHRWRRTSSSVCEPQRKSGRSPERVRPGVGGNPAAGRRGQLATDPVARPTCVRSARSCSRQVENDGPYDFWIIWRSFGTVREGLQNPVPVRRVTTHLDSPTTPPRPSAGPLTLLGRQIMCEDATPNRWWLSPLAAP
jgi:hypothetical protein